MNKELLEKIWEMQLEIEAEGHKSDLKMSHSSIYLSYLSRMIRNEISEEKAFLEIIRNLCRGLDHTNNLLFKSMHLNPYPNIYKKEL